MTTDAPILTDTATGRDSGSHQRIVKHHIVALSGGKDSTAMALRLAEIEPRDYTYICTPTGSELPPMKAHWQRLEDILQKEIVRLQTMTLRQLIERERMLPNFRARFCTHILKIIEFEKYLVEHLPCLAYVGLRADEPNREGASYGIELFIRTRHPLREWNWGRSQVLSYLTARGVNVPKRTDCAECPLQSLPEWYALWLEWPQIYEEAAQLEDKYGHTFRSPGRDTWPASLRLLAAEFAAGRIPKPRQSQDVGCGVCRM